MRGRPLDQVFRLWTKMMRPSSLWHTDNTKLCTVHWEHVTSSKSKQTLLYMKFLTDMWPRNYQSSGLQTPYNCLTVTSSFNILRNILGKLTRWNMGSDKITRSEDDEIDFYIFYFTLFLYVVIKLNVCVNIIVYILIINFI